MNRDETRGTQPRATLCAAQFIESMAVGGAEHLAVNLANALAAAGCESHLIVASGRGPLSERVAAGVHAHYLDRGRSSLRNPLAFTVSVTGGVGRLAGLVKDAGIQVMQTHLPGANFWGLALALRGACAVLPTVHNNEEFHYGDHDSRVLRALRRSAYGLMVRRCPGVIAVSEPVKTSLCHQLGLDGRLADRVIVMPNAVPLPVAPDPEARLSIRARYGAGPDEVLLLAAGRFCPQKNFGDLVAVAGRLREQGEPFRLVIAGDGEEHEAVADSVAAAGLGDRVVLPGLVMDLDLVMGAADVFLMSSRWEGLPLVLLEAMAAGLPVVGYGIDGIAEVVDNGVTGLVVPPGSPSALADAAGRLVAGDRERVAMGEAARQMISRRFDFQALVESLTDLYRRSVNCL